MRGRIREREGGDAEPGRLMRPEAIAEALWQLFYQPPDAWSSELEIRPFGEKW